MTCLCVFLVSKVCALRQLSLPILTISKSCALLGITTAGMLYCAESASTLLCVCRGPMTVSSVATVSTDVEASIPSYMFTSISFLATIFPHLFTIPPATSFPKGYTLSEGYLKKPAGSAHYIIGCGLHGGALKVSDGICCAHTATAGDVHFCLILLSSIASQNLRWENLCRIFL